MNSRLPVLARRAQLVDAALAVAEADGIAATTVRRVAERAGVALGVVHYAFADKDELLDALAARIVDELTIAGLVLDEQPDARSALQAAVDGLWSGIEQTAGAQLLTYEITTYALRTPGLRDVAGRQYAASQAAAERLLEMAIEAAGANWTRPVAEPAAEALAFVDGVTLRWLVDGDSGAARRRLASFADYLAAFTKPRRRLRKAGT